MNYIVKSFGKKMSAKAMNEFYDTKDASFVVKTRDDKIYRISTAGKNPVVGEQIRVGIDKGRGVKPYDFSNVTVIADDGKAYNAKYCC